MLFKLLHLLIQLLIILVFIHALGSWFPQIRESRFYALLDRLIEPMLRPIRQVLPYMGGIDISPMILIFILIVIDRLIGR
ncbi:YggT family protein [Hydrogenivirga caldilitoris]|uniref:YggT family protein n=1 Tax=Hydrogenivirga caldilitoris TaxID=246264 RepID=A0A497XLX0_9AQUI|nr:YggT family protein [Hydrogenivirga caldilitoris]RLJ69825.1 YggT family protein [Hydrogenivirga caldilitoris]